MLPHKDGGPFAFKTPLGWYVVRLLTKLGKKSSISCNHVLVQDAATRKMTSHHLGISSKVKYTNAKQILENIYNTEFCKSRLTMGIAASNLIQRSEIFKIDE